MKATTATNTPYKLIYETAVCAYVFHIYIYTYVYAHISVYNKMYFLSDYPLGTL